MRIGIIGAGHIGSTLARHFTRVGYDVAVSNSRGPRSLDGLVAELGPRAQALTPEEAARFGEVVVVSIPFGRWHELPSAELSRKVVIDTSNYLPERDGHERDLDQDTITSSQKIRAHTGGNVVKAFNALPWQDLRDGSRPKGAPDRLAVALSGSDEDGKAVVAGLVRDIGFDPVDAGNLGRGGRRHQPGTQVFGRKLPKDEMSEIFHAVRR
ncbi:NAD(P)-binding domain-containing protein [Streptomyces sp. PLAI1-29]|uniref:NAD(P)-binding domain-containing protein n=2 Tax=Streptomyces zingiberis TaxID=2053010 RepID=A0ABX1BYG0_9ACTN|nr:NAD(P)-binding domain-containing protein [Streptomyces zingiberis]NJQ00354.1 NAD(P)-binding domain-containing protein [Streptomyces zingiberis]